MSLSIQIPIDSLSLEGILAIPEKSRGIIIFVHGSGSGRFSPRNNFVARVLNEAGFSTLLFDLLTEKEDQIYENRFNIDLLTERLVLITKWIAKEPKTRNLNIGYFGASTGAAAAIQTAASIKEIKAIVSRGGRPDLAMDALEKIKSPTLLIVGGNDKVVIELNEKALKKIKSEKELKIIPGATHLFEEPGTLEEVAKLATEWFKKFL